ncbi:MAG: MSMEG_4193 family putative phosphomutase [Roseiflexaceae bacterium]|nr:MSMEG_4193 family putative phosphomutase [Roseiflexaceae bacterium]
MPGQRARKEGALVSLVLLIRHGTNDWVHGRLAGWTPGVHLNEAGRKQAESLAARLVPVPIHAIYTSPLERTLETARALATPRGMPIHIVEAIGEVKYGEWNGAELKELYKHELWPGVQHYPSGTRFPGGETLGESQTRMVQAIDTLRNRHPKETIAVVSHADMIRLALAYYLGIHIDLFQRLAIEPCSLSAVSFSKMGPRLVCYNDLGTLDHLIPKPEEPTPAKDEQPQPEQSAVVEQPQTEQSTAGDAESAKSTETGTS